MSTAEPTGTVPIGRYRLEVGGTSGTAIAPGPEADAPAVLVTTLAKAPAEQRRSPGEVAGGAVDRASQVTAGIAEALELFRALVEGRLPDSAALAAPIDRLLAMVQRLEYAERWDEALRLSRALCGLLALAMRWVELVRSLRVVMRAAGQVGDQSAEAWAKHELGTLHLAAEQPADAEQCLSEAQALRERLGERAALAATERNLLVLCRRQRALERDGPVEERRRLLRPAPALLLAALMLLLLGGVAGALIEHDRASDEQSGGSGGAATAPIYQLTVHRQGRGTVKSAPAGIRCPSKCDHEYGEGTRVTLTPRAMEGTTFAGWSGDCDDTPCRVSMRGARSVMARFTSDPGTALLTVSRSGDGDGRVTSEQPGIDCGADCVMPVALGASVRLSAEAGEGSTFDGWTIVGCFGTGPCDVTLDGDRRVPVEFDATETPPGDARLTVRRRGNGTVTSDLAGIQCPEDCQHEFPVGTQVTLTASPDAGSVFTGWSGACSDSGACVVTLDGPQAAVATFAPPAVTPTPSPFSEP